MEDYGRLTVREALQQHYRNSNLPHDGGYSRKQWTLITLGPVNVQLPNFAWRKRALHCHDIHHLVTGYPCTKAGELQIAAWEFAAGRFPNVCSTLFCLPLVGIGALVIPRKSFSAFVIGRRSKTLYAMGPTADVLGLRVRELRKKILPPTEFSANWRDYIGYFLLAVLSLAPLIGLVLGLFVLLR